MKAVQWLAMEPHRGTSGCLPKSKDMHLAA